MALDLPKCQTWLRFLYNAPTSQLSSSYVYSFGSYRVDKQTNKQTDAAETFNALRYATTLSKYWRFRKSGEGVWVDRWGVE